MRRGLSSVNVYNKLYGLPTHHPLVAVVDLKEATQLINNAVWKYGVYALTYCVNKLGIDHVMFSCDFPYVPLAGACPFLENTPLSEEDKEKDLASQC